MVPRRRPVTGITIYLLEDYLRFPGVATVWCPAGLVYLLNSINSHFEHRVLSIHNSVPSEIDEGWVYQGFFFFANNTPLPPFPKRLRNQTTTIATVDKGIRKDRFWQHSKHPKDRFSKYSEYLKLPWFFRSRYQ